ncbi:hypothetical protein HQ945_05270 [Phyllobacterium sp. BT25]|uniref:Uncharacterized protein n=1 Tax=Phyllobacterium pellucidum TaxID=2740464 RepID=A0A849VLA4_9HYPH|nr:hypothetical protein [Phyllobacterium pellucidum]NTS30658.1 hypothetical protein [Phyllobacterium pellucidum]
MEILSAKYLPDGTIAAILPDNTVLTIADVVVDQKLRDPETDELTGEIVRVGGTPERQKLLEWQAEGNTIEPWIAFEPVPGTISDRQFFQQLAVGGLITESEALAAVQTGTLPAAIVAFIDQLPDEQQFPARMLLTGATSFERAHPLTDAFGSMYGMDREQIDQLWGDAAQL